jgi:hypothetical protein
VSNKLSQKNMSSQVKKSSQATKSSQTKISSQDQAKPISSQAKASQVSKFLT